jgi:hypothetical protein
MAGLATLRKVERHDARYRRVTQVQSVGQYDARKGVPATAGHDARCRDAAPNDRRNT